MDVAGIVCEQEKVALLDVGEVVMFMSVDDTAIADGPIMDGVRVLQQHKDVIVSPPIRISLTVPLLMSSSLLSQVIGVLENQSFTPKILIAGDVD